MLGTTHHSGRRRRVAFAGLCVGLALVTAAPVAAYPITPDGEPLHLESATPTSSMPPEGISPDPLSATDFASNSTDWSGAISIAAVSALSALAFIAVAFALTSRRRRSAGAH